MCKSFFFFFRKLFHRNKCYIIEILIVSYPKDVIVILISNCLMEITSVPTMFRSPPWFMSIVMSTPQLISARSWTAISVFWALNVNHISNAPLGPGCDKPGFVTHLTRSINIYVCMIHAMQKSKRFLDLKCPLFVNTVNFIFFILKLFKFSLFLHSWVGLTK